MKKICKICGKPIRGKYIKFGDEYFHPEHITCSVCGKTIRHRLFKKGASYYHLKCYKKRIAPTCKSCGEKIIGNFIEFDGNKYHEKCFYNNEQFRCDICRNPLSRTFVEDLWGNRYCSKHRNEYEKCPYCSTLIAPGLKNSKVEYEDGRVICGTCDKKAVSNLKKAKKLLSEILPVLRRFTIKIDDQTFYLELVSKKEIEKKFGPYHEGNQYGYAEMKTIGGDNPKNEFKVFILSGLPDFEYQKACTHELMHIWIFQNTPYPKLESDDIFIEGSCEFASYLFLKSQKNKYNDLKLKCLENQDEGVYGEGFHRVKDFVNDHSVKWWLKCLKKGKNPL